MTDRLTALVSLLVEHASPEDLAAALHRALPPEHVSRLEHGLVRARSNDRLAAAVRDLLAQR